MRATDLRIGNYIGCDGDILIVEKIDSKNNIGFSLFKKAVGQHVNSGNKYYIELTEEILLNKTPFQKINDAHYAYLSFMIWRVENRFYYDKNGTELKYIHDLQNSFYYNTNKVELTINL